MKSEDSVDEKPELTDCGGGGGGPVEGGLWGTAGAAPRGIDVIFGTGAIREEAEIGEEERRIVEGAGSGGEGVGVGGLGGGEGELDELTVFQRLGRRGDGVGGEEGVRETESIPR